MNKKTRLPTIFIAIASYRDSECQHTVRDAFAKARHPERITIGICWQFDRKEDTDCFEFPPPFPKQVRKIDVHPEESGGVCWARAEMQRMWKGEDYVLQIDSHMRFEQDWDEMMIDMISQCENPAKSVLTGYPPAYDQPNELHRGWICVMKAANFDNDGILRLSGHNIKEVDAPDHPQRGMFCAAGFLFGPAQWIKDVPYDPHLYFYGEESTLTVRLWTHGWDIYHPHKIVIFHLYKRSGEERKRTHFADHADWSKRNKRSIARALHLLGTKQSDDREVLHSLENFGLGNERTLQEYQRFAGVNFARQQLASWATSGREYGPFTRKPRIFIAIASYRDPECQHTIHDAFTKAAHPDRITAGICWQFDNDEDRDCFVVPPPYPSQVRRKDYQPHESKGGCWARVEALSLWQGEDYILQIDAHMRFVEGWDDILLDTLSRCPTKYPVLSTTLPDYQPPRTLQDCTDGVPILYVSELANHDGLQPISLGGYLRNVSTVEPGPILSAFISGNFLFGPARAFSEVPFDPHIYFRGQEPAYSSRLFTHGWDIYQPDRVVMYHYWESKPRGSSIPYKESNDKARLAYERVMHVLGVKHTLNPAALTDIDIFGQGKVRPLADFWSFADVDLKNGIIGNKAREGKWTTYQPTTFGVSGTFRNTTTLDMKTGKATNKN